MLTDDELTTALATLPGDRITEDYIRSRIASTLFQRLDGMGAPTVTLCCIVLDNGYSVRGESACVDPANYDRSIGERLAADDAFRKLWPLFGFLLAERRWRTAP
jgi:Phage protein (N4 Gp49/phage Sf6 gene 66) family